MQAIVGETVAGAWWPRAPTCFATGAMVQVNMAFAQRLAFAAVLSVLRSVMLAHLGVVVLVQF